MRRALRRQGRRCSGQRDPGGPATASGSIRGAPTARCQGRGSAHPGSSTLPTARSRPPRPARKLVGEANRSSPASPIRPPIQRAFLSWDRCLDLSSRGSGGQACSTTIYNFEPRRSFADPRLGRDRHRDDPRRAQHSDLSQQGFAAQAAHGAQALRPWASATATAWWEGDTLGDRDHPRERRTGPRRTDLPGRPRAGVIERPSPAPPPARSSTSSRVEDPTYFAS